MEIKSGRKYLLNNEIEVHVIETNAETTLFYKIKENKRTREATTIFKKSVIEIR